MGLYAVGLKVSIRNPKYGYEDVFRNCEFIHPLSGVIVFASLQNLNYTIIEYHS